jgi:hypothetical protein
MPDVSSPISFTPGYDMRLPALVDYVPIPAALCDSAAPASDLLLDSLLDRHATGQDNPRIRKGDNVVTPRGCYCTVLGVSAAGRATIVAEDGTVVAFDVDRLQKVEPKYASERTTDLAPRK